MSKDDPLQRRGVHISDIDNQVVGTGSALLVRFFSPNGVAQDVFFELAAAEKLMAILQESLVQTYAQRGAEGGLAPEPAAPPRQEVVRSFQVGGTHTGEAAVLHLATNEDRPLWLTIPRVTAVELSRQFASAAARLKTLAKAKSGSKPRRH